MFAAGEERRRRPTRTGPPQRKRISETPPSVLTEGKTMVIVNSTTPRSSVFKPS
jgi:hypothetical protein